MIALTPVTNRAITIESGSTLSATLALKPPTGSQSNNLWTNTRCPPVRNARPTKVTSAATNDRLTTPVASHPAHGLPSRRPAMSRTKNPTSGSTTMRNAAWSTVP